MTKSGLNLVVTGTSTGRVVMLEAEADNLDAALFVDGVECGLQAWLPDGYSQIFRSYMIFGPSGFWTMAPLRYAAKFDPFLFLDCAPTPSTLAQSKERKGSNFAIWQPCCWSLLVTPDGH